MSTGVTFHNADNGFCMLRVVGHAAMISAGEFAQVPMVVTSISATLPMRKKVVRKLLAIVQDRIPKRFGLDPIREIQVLCPMNRGGLGARSLSIELQKQLNSPAEIRIERFGWTFCPGEKVMQVENDYDKDVYNGDHGVVSRIDMEEGELCVDFDGRVITYGFGDLDELVLAYATTITRARARNTRRWSFR